MCVVRLKGANCKYAKDSTQEGVQKTYFMCFGSNVVRAKKLKYCNICPVRVGRNHSLKDTSFFCPTPSRLVSVVSIKHSPPREGEKSVCVFLFRKRHIKSCFVAVPLWKISSSCPVSISRSLHPVESSTDQLNLYVCRTCQRFANSSLKVGGMSMNFLL